MIKTLCLDYDHTYQGDTDLFDDIIFLFFNRGWNVILATYRHPTKDWHPDFDNLEAQGVKCYFTDGHAKKPFLEDLGIKVDIWIDDNPKAILEDSAWPHESPELNAWREEQRKLGKIQDKEAA